VRSGRPRPADVTHDSVTPTATVDRTRPANDSAQNGSISRTGSLASERPQVHRRFRWYEGTVATDVATTFASQAVSPSTAVEVARMEMLIAVVSTETLMQRVSFPTSER
jgi:hypothetical protein